ncbi:MAG: acetyl-CoA carboxylase biotin carboxylase subunit [Dehalococcoidia bacterium]|nr:MAG: acetyl-CoA carboxylase biotin carboxylase subunit [Dehalococcoidia bacterium]
MFEKVLVANRGEIAVRIMRTCDRLGIATVAVYSDADRGALHVRRAAEAVRIGPARPSESYLDIDASVAAARSTGADAIHPGYGFLSENPALAEACVAAGIAFVGPSAAAMRLLGDKAAARRLAQEHDVPVLPGIDAGERDDAQLVDAAASVGFPLMVKAAGGGGGRGMRLVATADELPEALASARREATAAFGDGRLIVERAVVGGRHVEVQVLADARGNAIHLGERDCSVQRRHQKVIEETPAPRLGDDTRARMCEAALTVVRAAGYANAGTVEFLLDADGSFYFLEVNTRLQVEHPVTEMLTGLDLVELQLRVAAGEALPLSQADVRRAGCAIECRIAAEDPSRGYLPSSGRITYFRAPFGDGVRVDSGVETGSRVPPEYDSLVAKLIVHGDTRDEALRRAARALAALAVEGVHTNVALLEAVVASPAFAEGRHDLALLESMPRAAFVAQLPADVLLAAIAADVLPSSSDDPWQALGAWRASGPARLAYVHHGGTFAIDIERAGRGRWRALVDGRDRVFEADLTPGPFPMREGEIPAPGKPADRAIVVRADGDETSWRARRDGAHLLLASGDREYVLTHAAPAASGAHAGTAAHRTGEVRAPMPGVVVRVLVAEGEAVADRQPLAVLEAMKIEHIVESTAEGRVRAVRCEPGQRVAEGDILVEIESGAESGDATS